MVRHRSAAKDVSLGFAQIDHRYRDARVPLSRHMLATWHRFDKRRDFHIQSDASRLDFIVWYIWDYIPDRNFVVDMLPGRILSVLIEPVACHATVPKFFFLLWNRSYKHEQNFNIFEEEGYYRFLSEICFQEASKRGVYEVLYESVVTSLNAPQPGYTGDYHLSRALYRRWADTAVYQQKYPDLHDLATLQAYIFDQIIHDLANSGPELYSPDLLRWWATPIHRGVPGLTRFMVAIARYSDTMKPLLRETWLSVGSAQRIVDWFSDAVVPSFPLLGRFTQGPDASKGRPAAVIETPRDRSRNAAARPLIVTGTDQEIDVLVIGPYSAPSGLGSGTRRSVGALQRLGCNFRVADNLFDTPHGASSLAVPNPHRGEVATINLWHFNGEYVFDVMATARELPKRGYNIGYFFWETETLPICHELGSDIVDEIWAPSEFCADIYRQTDTPVTMVGTSVELPDVGPFHDRSYFGLNEDEFVFMFSFDAHSVIHRKNPAAVVRAFLKVFGGGNARVRLVIKTQNMLTAHWSQVFGRGEELLELCRYDPRVTLLDRTMSLRELYSLKASCDCYISLHRSEGFGYGPAEAMALGKPVIMTDFSANKEFGNAANAFMVPGPLIPVLPDEYLYWTSGMMWADPDTDIAAEHMRRVYEDAELRAEIARAGQVSVTRDFGVDRMAERYGRRLAELGVRVG